MNNAEKMKLGIYLDNSNITGVDCTDPFAGNPGIGGTEYCIIMLLEALDRYVPEIEVVLYTEAPGKLPQTGEKKIVSGIDRIGHMAAEDHCDLLLISALYRGKPLPASFFDRITAEKMKTVLWGHNYYYSDYCDVIADCKEIAANVFVGRQQYDRYLDHRIIEKSAYIYNMYPEQTAALKQTSNHTVTYIGSLVPAKGFHVLARAWKEILSQVPDAQLNVIGSGKLYSRNARLGKYEIAEEAYENRFISDLQDDSGKLLPSVHFLGIMGKEKQDVLHHTAVGVVNPTGRTETFGISALDFESLGVPVVTVAKGGFLDTVIHEQTGLLYKRQDRIVQCVVRLLRDEQLRQKCGENGRELAGRFAPEIIVEDWRALLHNAAAGRKPAYEPPRNFMGSGLKWLRMANRQGKKVFHIRKGLSVIGLESFAACILRRIRK